MDNLGSASGIPNEKRVYRPDIDGLRAFSILSVVLYHAFPRALPGGFVGVDVFFVISGYLISGIILRGLKSGTFSYATFYQRRIKRIFPALVVVLPACTLAGWLFLFPSEWKELEKYVFAGATFLSNFFQMYYRAGYFDSQVKALLHLWSLGIEEQFYIVWPLLLVVVWRWRAATLPLILLVFSSSFVVNLALTPESPVAAFYSPLTRFWELAGGAVLAYGAVFRPNLCPSGRGAAALSGLGMGLLLVSIFAIDQGRPFPGTWALLPTLGAFFTIAAGPNAAINRVVLASPVPVFFGLISYPLYLWHWPMLYFSRLLFPLAADGLVSIAAVAVSIVLSYLTYRWIETPLRHHRSMVAVPCGLALAIGTIGLLAAGLRYVAPRLDSPRSQVLLAAHDDWEYFGDDPQNNAGLVTGQVGHGSDRILFFGDSHIEQYCSRVRSLEARDREHFPTTLFATHGGCPPIPEARRADGGHACAESFRYAAAQADDPRVTTVVIGAYWERYFGVSTVDESLPMKYADGDLRTARSVVDLAGASFNRLGTYIRAWTSHGKRVFVILSNPASREFNVMRMISRFTGVLESRDVDIRAMDRARPILDKLRTAASESGAILIDPATFLCTGRACPTVDQEGQPIYKDDDHLRSSWVARNAVFIDQIFASRL